MVTNVKSGGNSQRETSNPTRNSQIARVRGFSVWMAHGMTGEEILKSTPV